MSNKNPLQPSDSSQFVSGIQPHTTANLNRQKTIALWFSVVSVAAFVLALFTGLLFGFLALALWLPVLAITGLLGAYGIALGIRTKSRLVITLGCVGLFSTVLTLVLMQLFL